MTSTGILGKDQSTNSTTKDDEEFDIPFTETCCTNQQDRREKNQSLLEIIMI